jgi:hypothetical protein
MGIKNIESYSRLSLMGHVASRKLSNIIPKLDLELLRALSELLLSEWSGLSFITLDFRIGSSWVT